MSSIRAPDKPVINRAALNVMCPRPVHGDDGAVTETDQEVNVRDAPQQPGSRIAFNLRPPSSIHRALAADRRERSEVAIGGKASACGHRPGRVAKRRHTSPAVFATGATPGRGFPSSVTLAVSPMTKDIGMARHRKVGIYDDAPCVVGCRTSQRPAGEAVTPAAHMIVRLRCGYRPS